MTLVWSPDYLGSPGKMVLAKDYPADADVKAYVAAVEAADGQALELEVIKAYDNFILGCKSDGIWNAIKASCILAGARTLSGALVPLVGTAPTNFNFTSSDYDRELGLGDASNTTKYLLSNLAYNSILTDDEHLSVFTSTAAAGNLIGGGTISPTCISRIGYVSARFYSEVQSNTNQITSGVNYSNFIGANRSSSANLVFRSNGSNTTYPVNSTTRSTASTPYGIFCGNYSDLGVVGIAQQKIAFYSIGESLDLALLDARVSTLISDLGAAIP